MNRLCDRDSIAQDDKVVEGKKVQSDPMLIFLSANRFLIRYKY